MKLIVTTLLFLTFGLANAATYHVDSNGNDKNNGTALPWQTIAKVNSFSFSPGDSVLFRKGQTYTGNLVATSNVHYGMYGTGTGNPVLTVARTLTGWTTSGGNIWHAAFPGGDYLNCVLVKGIIVPMGRYPNANTRNKGYLNYESHSGTTSITDKDLPNTTDWTGAEVVIRKTEWVTDRCLVTAQQNGAISYKNFGNAYSFDLSNGYGYFFQNDLRTLDQQNEWYYNRTTGTFYIYSTAMPANVQVSTAQHAVTVLNVNHVSFSNLIVEAGDTAVFDIDHSSNITIKKCEIRNGGTNGIHGLGSSYVTIDSCFIHDVNNTAMHCPVWYGSYNTNSRITHNKIIRCGLYPGMGSHNNQQRSGMIWEGNGNTIAYNYIDSVGYCGIMFNRSNIAVRYNQIYHFCLTAKDGAGIGNDHGGTTGDVQTNRLIANNIIGYGIGSPEGTTESKPTAAVGIYLDEADANVTVDNNYIFSCTEAGIYLHNSFDIQVTNNIVRDCETALLLRAQPIKPYYAITGLTVTHNTFYSSSAFKPLINIETMGDSISSIGRFDSNYYYRPFAPGGIIRYMMYDGPVTGYDLTGWQQAFNRDVHGSFGFTKPEYAAVAQLGANKAQVSSLNINGPADNNRVYMGDVTYGHEYLVKFSMSGQPNHRNVKAFILGDGGTYPLLCEERYYPVSKTNTAYEYLFSPNQSFTKVFMGLDFSHLTLPATVTNISIYEVNAQETNLNNFVHFIANNTPSNKGNTIPGVFKDSNNKTYTGNVTLPPFSAKMLIKNDDLRSGKK